MTIDKYMSRLFHLNNYDVLPYSCMKLMRFGLGSHPCNIPQKNSPSIQNTEMFFFIWRLSQIHSYVYSKLSLLLQDSR
jgi:hypothetical protein